MKFLQILLSIVTFFSFAAAQADIVRGVLNEIQADATELRNAFTAEDAPRIEAAGFALIDSINAGVPVVNASRALTLLEALTFSTQIINFQDEISATADLAIEKKPVIDRFGLTARVLEAFLEGRASVNTLATVLLTKIPASLQTTARDMLAKVDADMARVIAAYS